MRAVVRRRVPLPEANPAQLTICLVDDLACTTHFENLLAGADAVVHLAGRVHHLAEKQRETATYVQENVHMTRALADAAHRAGVRRFVFMSSIKALGDRSDHGAFARDFPPQPVDAYGLSKLNAERQLAAISAATGLEVVVIRAPLVYGSGASANFRELVRWVRRGVPLPLAQVHNRRSVVSVENLADFIVRCLGMIDGLCNTFHVADARPVSKAELLRYVADGLQMRARLFPMPISLLEVLCRVIGRADIAARLLNSLEFETEDSFAALDWRPGNDTREGVIRALRGMKF